MSQYTVLSTVYCTFGTVIIAASFVVATSLLRLRRRVDVSKVSALLRKASTAAVASEFSTLTFGVVVVVVVVVVDVVVVVVFVTAVVVDVKLAVVDVKLAVVDVKLAVVDVMLVVVVVVVVEVV